MKLPNRNTSSKYLSRTELVPDLSYWTFELSIVVVLQCKGVVPHGL